MKNRKLWSGFTLVVATLVILPVKNLRADEVYNFYFQKAPVPAPPPAALAVPATVSVVQSSPAPVPPPEASQNSTRAEPLVKAEQPKGFSRWRFLLGRSSYGGGMAELSALGTAGNAPYQAGDWDLGIEFNIWKSLGIDLRGLQAVGQPINLSPGQENSTLGYSAGLDFSPFHIKIAGYELLDIGFTGGYTSFSTQSTPWGTISDGTLYYNNSNTAYFSGQRSSYYLGIKAGINIGDSFAVIAAAEELPEAQSSRLTFGLELKL